MRRERGFTLIELLTVMVIVGVMMGIGIPSFRNFIASQRVKSAAYDVSTSLLFARSEAIKRNTKIKVAPPSGTDWGTGWQVTVDSDGTVLQKQDASTGITITLAPATIVFQGSGRPTATSISYWQIDGPNNTRCIRLDTAGVASAHSGACS